MAINTPHGEKAVQRPSSSKDDDNATVETQNVASGPQHEASNEDFRGSGTISSLSSQENSPSAISSPFQVSSPLPSPSQRHSFNPSPSQLDSPLSSPFLQPSLLSSSSSLQSPPGSLPSPYERGSNISIEQLNELALQDSENNNVDENSNQGFDQYAEVAHEYVPDQSVRPRVRAQYPGGGRDQPDRAPINVEARTLMRRRSSGSSSYSHRRNLSEDLACSPTTSFPYFDDDSGQSMEYDRLPRLPNYPSDRRDSWCSPQPLPPREDPSFFQSMTRILPLNLRGGGYGPQPPPFDNTIEDDAQDLLSNFTSETLHRNSLPKPNTSILRQGYRNPALFRVGQELRKLADAFAETEERRNVQRMAESVNLESINMENFFHLCTELFMGGITRERIVALFTFVGDVAVFHVRRQGQQFLQVLMTWSWKYLVDYICRWVKEAGGWGAVLSRGANALYTTAVIAFCLLGTAAAGIYIVKTLKDW
ncbi:uncharacterized protein [Palaemon carinicauda]|uniref:uncharacterized protein n=1 Tax=Palaemon carinicauda TaxID=392227 RepID=UPI0035B670F1